MAEGLPEEDVEDKEHSEEGDGDRDDVMGQEPEGGEDASKLNYK